MAYTTSLKTASLPVILSLEPILIYQPRSVLTGHEDPAVDIFFIEEAFGVAPEMFV